MDLVREIADAQDASHVLVEHALKESTDNITAMVVRFHDSPAAAGSKALKD